MAEERTSFGAALRRHRQAAGMSLGQLAGVIHYSKSYLSKIENESKPAGVDLARRCDAALGAGGALAAQLQVRRRSPEEPASARSSPESGRSADGSAVDWPAAGWSVEHGGGEEMWEMVFAPDGTSRFVPRRDVLRTGVTGAVSLFGLGVGSGVRGISAAAREETTVQSFWALFDQTRQLGQRMSPSVLLPVLVGQAQAVRGLTASAGASVRRQLLLLGARYAEFTGWMAQESGDDRATAWWTDHAVRLATSAGDADLATYAFVRRAEIALYREDAAGTVELAARARADHRVSPRVRSLAAQREAQGHALAGDYDECRRSLDRAAELVDRDAAAQGHRPALGSSALADPIAIVRGWCLLDVGRPEEAARLLGPEVARIPVTGRRARARFGARLALAHAVSGQVDAACAVANQVLDDAEHVDSATIRCDLRRLARTLTRWHSHPPVRELSPRLTAALHNPASF